jgi:hypothetical protein
LYYLHQLPNAWNFSKFDYSFLRYSRSPCTSTRKKMDSVPQEILVSIVLYMPVKDIVSFGRTCSKYKESLSDGHLWGLLLIRDGFRKSANIPNRAQYINEYMIHLIKEPKAVIIPRIYNILTSSPAITLLSDLKKIHARLVIKISNWAGSEHSQATPQDIRNFCIIYKSVLTIKFPPGTEPFAEIVRKALIECEHYIITELSHDILYLLIEAITNKMHYSISKYKDGIIPIDTEQDIIRFDTVLEPKILSIEILKLLFVEPGIDYYFSKIDADVFRWITKILVYNYKKQQKENIDIIWKYIRDNKKSLQKVIFPKNRVKYIMGLILQDNVDDFYHMFMYW